ncbi:MAG: hypothetical protein KIS92_22110 [Planctomycetota bacterium]|nr:hypothetical protein [Planctomycetota bacterium]
MERNPPDDAEKKVAATHEPVVITTADGDKAKIIPIPKPVKTVNGRPVYKLEDMQFLEVPPP